MIQSLRPHTQDKCVSALRYIKQQFNHGHRIDAIDMEAVFEALALVDAEAVAARSPIEKAQRCFKLAAE